MAGAQGTYRPRPGATLESELDVLAAAYSYLIHCRAKKRAAEPTSELSSLDDGKERFDRVPATKQYPGPA
jgi:hypothetical protein